MGKQWCNGCSSGTKKVHLKDQTKGVNRHVSTHAGLAGAKPVMEDKTGCNKTPLHVRNTANGNK